LNDLNTNSSGAAPDSSGSLFAAKQRLMILSSPGDVEYQTQRGSLIAGRWSRTDIVLVSAFPIHEKGKRRAKAVFSVCPHFNRLEWSDTEVTGASRNHSWPPNARTELSI
jgi:hypothetical protein